tara:strand:- start:1654 stop:3054 length:1401 start_codon:yes stop_codon:yes gene_type:complete
MKYFLFSLYISISLCAKGQNDRIQYRDEESKVRMMNSVRFLASDELSGRLPGTDGARLAIDYILDAFERNDLRPLFENGFKQSFSIPRPVEILFKTNYLILGEDSLNVGQEFQVSPSSRSKEICANGTYVKNGIQCSGFDDFQSIDFNGLKNKVALVKFRVSKKKKKIAGKEVLIQKRLNNIINYGAQEVIFLSRKAKKKLLGSKEPIFMNLKPTNPHANVYSVQSNKWSRKIRKSKEPITIRTKVSKRNSEGENIIGFFDVGATHSILIGAHYDHLGKGEFYKNKEGKEKVYNGADDNASGVSVMLEILHQIQLNPELINYNLIFAAFSGEEDGLIGSRHFIKNCPIDPHLITHMINLDMVGRLNFNDSLIVYATSSSSQWGEVLNNISQVKLNIKNIPKIFPRSDHASFIEAGIPSIMLHTGIHKDYHTPDDDFQKIDANGLTKITEFVLYTLQNLNKFSNSKS